MLNEHKFIIYTAGTKKKKDIGKKLNEILLDEFRFCKD